MDKWNKLKWIVEEYCNLNGEHFGYTSYDAKQSFVLIYKYMLELEEEEKKINETVSSRS